jgi:hypothetical protein
MAESTAETTATELAASRDKRLDAGRQRAAKRRRRLFIATQLLGVGLIVGGISLIYVIVAIWPAVQLATASGTGVGPTTTTSPSDTPTTTVNDSDAATSQASSDASTQENAAPTISLFGARLDLNLDPETALLVLVVAASALGSYIHAATSFGTYVGNQRLTMSWIWWYLLRIFIGVALAVLFYFAVRGGLLSAQAQSGALNPYGVAALAAMVGLFSKQATDKLREVFETLFKTGEGYGDDERTDKITNPTPQVVEVEPEPPVRPQEQASLKLKGEGFVPESTVSIRRFGKDADPQTVVPASTRYVSATEMLVELEAKDLPPTTELEIIVVNPEPGGGESEPIRVKVGDLPETVTSPATATPQSQGRFRRRK